MLNFECNKAILGWYVCVVCVCSCVKKAGRGPGEGLGAASPPAPRLRHNAVTRFPSHPLCFCEQHTSRIQQPLQETIYSKRQQPINQSPITISDHVDHYALQKEQRLRISFLNPSNQLHPASRPTKSPVVFTYLSEFQIVTHFHACAPEGEITTLARFGATTTGSATSPASASSTAPTCSSFLSSCC